MSAVVEHKTYVAATCPSCHTPALRICIIHNQCEFNHHDYHTCIAALRDIQKVQQRIERDRAWLRERGF